MQNFDAGKLVESGGYAWPLSQWAMYYHLNVERIGSIKPEQFVREFPEAQKALTEMAERKAIVDRILNDEAASAALMQVVEHLMKGKGVQLVEGDGTPNEHVHNYNAPDGNGETDEVNGHKHAITGGKCMEADGHCHDMPAAGSAPAAAAKEGE